MVGKRQGLVVFVAGLSLLSLPVLAQSPAAAPAEVRPIGPDQELVGELHQMGRNAITTARLAEDQAVSPGVKAFAVKVRRDQDVANEALQDYGMRKNMNMDVVANPGEALPHGVLANAPLVNSPRDEFDYRFMSKVVSDNQGAFSAAAAAQRLARDPELKGLIGRQMAMLSDHQVVGPAGACPDSRAEAADRAAAGLSGGRQPHADRGRPAAARGGSGAIADPSTIAGEVARAALSSRAWTWRSGMS